MDGSDLKLMVTLWPAMEHFKRFATDSRLSGIRLNSAMMGPTELEEQLRIIAELPSTIPLWFDVKGWQLRIENIFSHKGEEENYLDLTLNHPISVETPVLVWFNAGTAPARLLRLEENGKRLIFQGGPKWMPEAGQSICIRHPSLKILGNQFTNLETAKIERVRKFGFTRFFQSYVHSQRDVDEFMEIAGCDSEYMLKIEDPRGLRFVAREFKKQDNLSLVAARGDLVAEIEYPHEILAAMKLIISKDPEAQAASRLLLSVNSNNEILATLRLIFGGEIKLPEGREWVLEDLQQPTEPAHNDFEELAWLYDIGYRHLMLCDGICLREDLLDTAINVFEAFYDSYVVPQKVEEGLKSKALVPAEPSIWSMVGNMFGGRRNVGF